MFITIVSSIWILLLGYGFQRRVSKKVLLATAILGTVLVIARVLDSATLQQYIRGFVEAVTTITLWTIVRKQFKGNKK